MTRLTDPNVPCRAVSAVPLCHTAGLAYPRHDLDSGLFPVHNSPIHPRPPFAGGGHSTCS